MRSAAAARRKVGSVRSYQTNRGLKYRATWRQLVDPENPEQGTKQVTKAGFPDWKSADAFLRRTLIDIEDGKVVSTTETTFREFADTWLDGFRGEAVTKAGYRRNLRLHIYPTLGRMPLKTIRTTTLSALYRKLEEGTAKVDVSDRAERKPLGPNTVLKCHVLIGTILQAAVDDHLVAQNVARHPRANPPTNRQVRQAKPEINPWTAEELELFRSWALDEESDPLRYGWVLVAHTGIRRSELLGLRWSDVDLVGKTISIRRAQVQVREKGRSTRTVESVPKSAGDHAGTHPIDIDDIAVDALRAQRRYMSGTNVALVGRDRPVFVNTDGKAFAGDAVTRRFSRAIGRYNRQASRAEKVTTIRFHDLRHTHATLLLQAGVHPKVVQERLGHSTITITMDLYSHVLPTTQRAAADAFAAATTGTRDRKDDGRTASDWR